jgi:hypothetical protein
MNTLAPRNGPLSGMALTAAAAAASFSLPLLSDAARERFSTPIGDDVAALFLVSALVMAAHKVESYLEREYAVCPVYITQSRSWGSDPARAIFLSFVPTFLGMLVLLALAMIGPPWHLAIVTVWIAQGLHELHHVAKSIARRRFYPGLFTALLFIAVQSGLLFPRWHDLVVGARGAIFVAYYALLPLVLVGYYLEDRRWTARAPRRIWDPRAREEFRLVDVRRRSTESR